ncbi:MAG: hypothetical protein K0Q73_1981 [Paenibacillus sp.]|jgi:hypothetical protein|nr:hypothetical protein [Paenibacillus sp.]
MNAKVIEVGDRVKWSSQSQGSVKEKAGIVQAVVNAGQNAKALLPAGLTRALIKFDTLISERKRYIVAVPRAGISSKIDYYCPRVTDLRMIEDQNGLG